MQSHVQRRSFRGSLLAFAILSCLSGAAHAQVSVTSPVTGTVTGRVPVLGTARITGTPGGAGNTYVTGDTLTATYTITDPDLDVADDAATQLTIQWTSGGVNVGTTGSKTYVIQASDSGKTITYSLVPKTSAAITDPAEGVRTLASTIGEDGSGGGDGGDGGEVSPAGSGTLLSVAITGSAVVAGTLTATPTCPGTCAGNITYQWQLETGVGTGIYANIAGATAGTYSPVRTDQRRRIKLIANQPAP